MYTYVATFLIGLVMSGISVWKVQDWRYASKEKDREQQELANVRQSAATAIRRTDAVIQAQNDATNRAIALRRDADGARAALIGLSHATDDALRTAASSNKACLDRASTLGELLNTMAEAGADLAAKADRINSDRQTLIDAWPK